MFIKVSVKAMGVLDGTSGDVPSVGLKIDGAKGGFKIKWRRRLEILV